MTEWLRYVFLVISTFPLGASGVALARDAGRTEARLDGGGPVVSVFRSAPSGLSNVAPATEVERPIRLAQRARAVAVDGWERLENDEITLQRTRRREHVTVEATLDRGLGLMVAIGIAATDRPLLVDDVIVIFGNGDQKRQSINSRLLPGEAPKMIKWASRRGRNVTRIEVGLRDRDRTTTSDSIEFLIKRAAEDLPQPPRGWSVIGMVPLDRRANRLTIDVPSSQARLTGLRFVVVDASVDLRNIRVTYANGRDSSVSGNEELFDREASQLISLSNSNRRITSIDVIYRRVLATGNEARLIVWGDNGAGSSLGEGRTPRPAPSSDLWVAGFGTESDGWDVARHPRFMADVNGDGRADLVGVHEDGVYVSLAMRDRFSPPQLWARGMGAGDGWDINENLRVPADVNGDGRADLVGFGNDGVVVALSNGDSFSRPRIWVDGYGQSTGGWKASQNPRMVADVNADGRADIIGISNDGVYVSLAENNRFSAPKLWVRAFGVNNGGWQVDVNPRVMADVNGDGRADIVGFSSDGVHVALARNGKFEEPTVWVRAYGVNNGGWQIKTTPRVLADVDGDGRADIVGFATGGVFVSLAKGNRFSEPKLWVEAFGLGNGGWQDDVTPRYVTDVNGDGKSDIVGFSTGGVWISFAEQDRFSEPQTWIKAYGLETGGWQSSLNPRLLGDVDGDGKVDIIGIANGGAFVTRSRF